MWVKKIRRGRIFSLDTKIPSQYDGINCGIGSVSLLVFLLSEQGYTMETQELGDHLRSMRLEKRLTLRQISQRTKYSISYLSQIERGQANPSIGTLHTITQALGETFASLFQADRVPGPPNSRANSVSDLPSAQVDLRSTQTSQFAVVVRKNQRKGLILPWSVFEQQLLSPDLNRKIEFLWTKIPPGTRSGLYQHEGEECGVIVEGTLVFRIGRDTFTLDKGDSIYFDSSNPHEFENQSNETVETIWAITPPSF
jgi:transcriptional regulator with XRE-family HTH domain